MINMTLDIVSWILLKQQFHPSPVKSKDFLH